MSVPFLLWASRPQHQNARWCELLQPLGPVLDIPLLAIVPVTNQADQQHIKSRILDLDYYEHVIFVSQNAVAQAFEWIEQYWPQIPVGVRWYAVGEKTAASVREHCVDVIECGQAMNSEALLALPDLQPVANQKILICRGKGGRTKLAEVLRDRGASVDYCELYERQSTSTDALATRLQQDLSDVHHVVPLFSGETLLNFTNALPIEHNKGLFSLVVPAERVAQVAQQAGFEQITIAQNASEASMLAATRQTLSTLLQKDYP